MAAPTHYQRLGVAPTATDAEIRAAYRTLARRLHPDAAGSAAGYMAAVNEAWRVLSDPGRRALYDRSLAAGDPVRQPGPAADRWEPDPVPVAPARTGRFPIWPFFLLFVLAAIFIVTAGALTSDPKPVGPDNLLFAGSCVVIEPNRDVREVDCGEPHDAVVETVVDFDQACPAGTQPYRDRQGRGWACIAA